MSREQDENLGVFMSNVNTIQESEVIPNALREHSSASVPYGPAPIHSPIPAFPQVNPSQVQQPSHLPTKHALSTDLKGKSPVVENAAVELPGTPSEKICTSSAPIVLGTPLTITAAPRESKGVLSEESKHRESNKLVSVVNTSVNQGGASKRKMPMYSDIDVNSVKGLGIESEQMSPTPTSSTVPASPALPDHVSASSYWEDNAIDSGSVYSYVTCASDMSDTATIKMVKGPADQISQDEVSLDGFFVDNESSDELSFDEESHDETSSDEVSSGPLASGMKEALPLGISTGEAADTATITELESDLDQASFSPVPIDIVFAHRIMANETFKLCQAQSLFSEEDGAYNFVALRLAKRQYILSPNGSPQAKKLELALQELNAEAICTITSQAVGVIADSMDEETLQITLGTTEHVQVVETVEQLAWARSAQKACFVRSERMLVVWCNDAEILLSTAENFQQKALLYVWRHRRIDGTMSLTSQSMLDMSLNLDSVDAEKAARKSFWQRSGFKRQDSVSELGESGMNETEKGGGDDVEKASVTPVKPTPPRPVMFYQALYAGLSAALAIVLCANFVRVVLMESLLDHIWLRLAILSCIPFLFLIILFVCDSVVGPIAMLLMPIRQMAENTMYYSGKAPEPLQTALPHITVVIPVYMESLSEVLAHTIDSVSKAIQTYELQGGTANIIVCEDGLQIVDESERVARIDYYDRYSCAWVARHPKNRAGRFKKSSNLNVMKRLSLRIESIMDSRRPDTDNVIWNQLQENVLYASALDEALKEHEGRIWASGNVRIGDYILLLDSDTRIPEDCLLDAASEMEASPEVAILQHCSGTFLVGAGYFEKGIAFFTHVVNFSISWIVASGSVAPFMGHNAILRWSALQHQAFENADGAVTIWSEEHVSEDFVMAMNLQRCGYIIRWATYSKLGYLEGVSLSCGDELNRWQKYAFGCSEIIFHPFRSWFKRGAIAKVWRNYLWSPTPIATKYGTISYVTSYWAIASALPLTFTVFAIQAATPDTLDHAFLTSNIGTPFSIFIGVLIIFAAGGSVGRIVARYRSEDCGLFVAFMEQIRWTPFFVCFFSGLSWHVCTALVAHITGYNMTWSATVKDITVSNMFIEIRLVFKRYWRTLILMTLAIAGTITVAAPILPLNLRTNSLQAIFPILWISSMQMVKLIRMHLSTNSIAYPLLLNPWVLLFRF